MMLLCVFALEMLSPQGKVAVAASLQPCWLSVHADYSALKSKISPSNFTIFLAEQKKKVIEGSGQS